MMKVDEFIKKVNQVAYAEQIDGSIFIEIQKSMYNHSWNLRLHPKVQNLEICQDWFGSENMDLKILYRVLELIQKLKDTPVQKRFPENKYRLAMTRWVEGPVVPIKQYVASVDASSDKLTFKLTCNKNNAMLVSDKALHNYSVWIDKKVLEAMKEEVEEDAD